MVTLLKESRINHVLNVLTILINVSFLIEMFYFYLSITPNKNSEEMPNTI